MNTYPAGDFLIRLKNSALAKNKSVEVVNSKIIKALAEVMKKEGFIREITIKDGILQANLEYFKKSPVLVNLKLVSKPGFRVYMTVKELEAKRGPSIFIITTSKGVMSSKSAIKARLGGEVIAEVW